MSLSPDLVEMLSAFVDGGVRFLVVGGHAVSLHARPRTTKDLDLWLEPEPSNITRACAALVKFGIQSELVSQLRTARQDEIVWIGRAPARVDFLQTLPGLEFLPCWERRTVVDVAGIAVPFVGRDDLLANKRAVGRPQDLRDVRAIERAMSGTKGKRRGRQRK